MLSDIGKQPWEWPYRLMIVDDGSTDATPRLLAEARTRMPMTVVTHEKNRGLGGALATGFAAVIKEIGPADVLITMDADRTHPLELIPLMKEKIESGYDIVIASRYAAGGEQFGLPAYRRMLSRSAAILLSIFWPKKGVRDYTSGYRAFSGKLIREAALEYADEFVTETGFTATFEVLLKTGALTEKITEVPLLLHYENKTGKSKMKVTKTVVRYLRLITAAMFAGYGKK
jgi:dolichol-phosphate mannosyltransferase